jgi:hypothetical protein
VGKKLAIQHDNGLQHRNSFLPAQSLSGWRMSSTHKKIDRLNTDNQKRQRPKYRKQSGQKNDKKIDCIFRGKTAHAVLREKTIKESLVVHFS